MRDGEDAATRETIAAKLAADVRRRLEVARARSTRGPSKASEAAQESKDTLSEDRRVLAAVAYELLARTAYEAQEFAERLRVVRSETVGLRRLAPRPTVSGDMDRRRRQPASGHPCAAR